MLQQLDDLEEKLERELEKATGEYDNAKADGHDKLSELDYYPPDPDYRLELELYEHEEKKTVRMAYTKGGERDFVRWGEFRFRLGDEQCVLQAYKSGPEEDHLFIPLRDATSGQETYGGGRYLDLNVTMNRTAAGKWILDLNEAYNPWCVFSEDYTCPLVPQENWLVVSVWAGEKNYAKT
jgi:uncharacterized protein (DUF1684 family)